MLRIFLKKKEDLWKASLARRYKNRDEAIKDLPSDYYKISGNEIEASIPLKDIGSPESFNYGFRTYAFNLIPIFDPSISTFGSLDFPDWPGPPEHPGTLTVDPNFEGSKEEEFSRIYTLPSHIEEMEVREINGKPTAIVNTKTEDYLFRWNSEEKEFEVMMR